MRRFPDVTFTGPKTGEELAQHYASADVFVFPSRTDTFGLVLLEAMASGVPVAAYPVTGPIDIVERGVSGYLDEDLGKAARAALTLDRAKVREDSFRFTWARTAELFLNNIGNVSASAAARVAAARTARAQRHAPGHAAAPRAEDQLISQERRWSYRDLVQRPGTTSVLHLRRMHRRASHEPIVTTSNCHPSCLSKPAHACVCHAIRRLRSWQAAGPADFQPRERSYAACTPVCAMMTTEQQTDVTRLHSGSRHDAQ